MAGLTGGSAAAWRAAAREAAGVSRAEAAGWRRDAAAAAARDVARDVARGSGLLGRRAAAA